MKQSMTRFSELLNFFPRNEFKKIVKKENADKHLRKFKSWNLLTTMLYGQISQSKSLRRLVDGFNSHSNNHYHLNTDFVKRSTISESLSKRSIEPFKQICESLMRGVSRVDRKKITEYISIIDSSPISLKGHGFSWTQGNKTNRTQGLKLHLELRSDEDSPTYINITAPNINDITDAKNNVELQESTTYVMDKGYLDYNWWFEINEKKSYFITRTKSNTAFKIIKELDIKAEEKEIILADQIIHLTNQNPRGGKTNNYALKDLRLVTVIRDGKKPMEIISNDFERSAQEIAVLYKKRWQIELFFKWIKQRLKLKSYFGTSENAVKIQIYCAIISYLLMRKMYKSSSKWQKLLELQTWLQHGIFIKDSINTYYFKRRKQRDKLICDLQMSLKLA